MKYILVVLLTLLVTGCATIRSPYQMAVTDFSGNERPYYVEGEALNIHVFWDANLDVGKPIDCAVSNSFSGELIWQSVLLIPQAKAGQYMSHVAWNPPFPKPGLMLKAGSYIAVCNFNNEAKASIPLNVVKLGLPN